MEGSNGHGLMRSREGGLARLELARPPRNLLDPDVMAQLREAILEADADAAVDAIVLTGGGESSERTEPSGTTQNQSPERHAGAAQSEPDQMSFVRIETPTEAPKLVAYGNAVRVEKYPYIVRFTPDGRYAIANGLYWGADVEGTWNEAPRGSVVSVKLDAGKADDGSPRHALVSRATTGVSPEGLAVIRTAPWWSAPIWTVQLPALRRSPPDLLLVGHPDAARSAQRCPDAGRRLHHGRHLAGLVVSRCIQPITRGAVVRSLRRQAQRRLGRLLAHRPRSARSLAARAGKDRTFGAGAARGADRTRVWVR